MVHPDVSEAPGLSGCGCKVSTDIEARAYQRRKCRSFRVSSRFRILGGVGLLMKLVSSNDLHLKSFL